MLFHALTVAERAALRLTTGVGIFVTGEDFLRLSTLNSLTAVRVSVTGRMLGLDGEVRPFGFAHAPNTDRTIAHTAFGVGDGWLLDVTAVISAAAPVVGQTWARLQVVRGTAATPDVLATLASGYLTAQQVCAWPGGAVRGTLEGPGAIRFLTTTNPAAGSEIEQVVPTGARWRVVSGFFTLAADATAANRNVHLVIDDGTTVGYQRPAAQFQTASQSIVYHFHAGSAQVASVNSATQFAFPVDVFVPSAGRIRTATTALEAADDFSAMNLEVEEWLEGA